VDVVAVEALTAAFLPAVLEKMIKRNPAARMSVRIATARSGAAECCSACRGPTARSSAVSINRLS
jgi:hypothetical protein